MRKVTKGSLIILSLAIIVAASLTYITKYSDLFGNRSKTVHDVRGAVYSVDIRDVFLSDTAEQVERNSFVSSMLTSKLKSEGSCLVQLSNGKVYDLTDQHTLLSMLESNDQKQHMMALYVLMHMAVLNQKIKPQLLDAVNDIYTSLITTYPWSGQKRVKASMIKRAFSIIMLSGGSRADKIREEAKKSDKKILEGLVQDVETIEQKLGRRKKRDGVSRPLKSVSRGLDSEGKNNVVSIPGITGIKACTREELITSLRKVMGGGSNDEKYQALNQLLQWRKYFKSKEGKEKRRAVTSLLMEYYKHEDTSFGVKEDIVTRLGDIGKGREVRSFLENIADDDETKEFIRDDAKMALEMWDAQHSNEK